MSDGAPICPHLECVTCRTIVVGLIVRQLATVPAELRAGVCVEALRLAAAPEAATPEAILVAGMIG